MRANLDATGGPYLPAVALLELVASGMAREDEVHAGPGGGDGDLERGVPFRDAQPAQGGDATRAQSIDEARLDEVVRRPGTVRGAPGTVFRLEGLA